MNGVIFAAQKGAIGKEAHHCFCMKRFWSQDQNPATTQRYAPQIPRQQRQTDRAGNLLFWVFQGQSALCEVRSELREKNSLAKEDPSLLRIVLTKALKKLWEEKPHLKTDLPSRKIS